MISLHEGAPAVRPRKKADRALVLRLSVAGTQPEIWRRLVVRESLWLSRLHDGIQIAFDWFDYQMHVFTVGERRLGNPQAGATPVDDDRDITLAEAGIPAEGRFSYRYHFGEGWTINGVVEEIRPLAKGERVPACLGGERAGPPEDCGGIEAFHDMLACLQEPNTELGREWREWVGPDYDPARCDAAAITRGLRKLPR
ncbi:MAG TPA: plasmid pRiA4b ORF-3 family protein [Opitutaceae bacterium]